MSETEQLKKDVVEALENYKAEDTQVLDVKGLTDVTDYMIICNGTSRLHTRAVARNIVDDLKKLGHRPLNEEGGGEDADWVLVDYGDVIVHIMMKEARDFYDLEKFWGEDMRQLVKAAREG